MLVPDWVLEDPTPDVARLRYFVRLAALLHNRDGSLRQLATAIGRSNSFFSVIEASGPMPMEDAVKIEQLLGRDRFQRELLRPDMTIPAA